MDVRERSEPGAAHRCPYCHDLLEGERRDDALLVCGDCGTRHHAACMDELGRCTVLGCTWTPPGTSGAGPGSGARSVDEVRRSVRERARRFVQEHSTRSPRRAAPRASRPPSSRLADRPERWASDEADLGRRALRVLLAVMLAAGALAIVLLVLAGVQDAIFGR